jgi:hypothetical protein
MIIPPLHFPSSVQVNGRGVREQMEGRGGHIERLDGERGQFGASDNDTVQQLTYHFVIYEVECLRGFRYRLA